MKKSVKTTKSNNVEVVAVVETVVTKRKGRCPQLDTDEIITYLRKAKKLNLLPSIVGSIDQSKFALIASDIGFKQKPIEVKPETVWNFIGIK
jgi:hypothetical protein